MHIAWEISPSPKNECIFLQLGDITKFGRGESTSPAPSASLSAHAPQTVQPPQAQSQGQNQPQPQGHHNTQQPFLNPALPPGYSYTGLPYYPGVPSAFQYGPTMYVPPASAKQHGMGLSNPTTPFQQPSGYGQHAFSSGLCRINTNTNFMHTLCSWGLKFFFLYIYFKGTMTWRKARQELSTAKVTVTLLKHRPNLLPPAQGKV